MIFRMYYLNNHPHSLYRKRVLPARLITRERSGGVQYYTEAGVEQFCWERNLTKCRAALWIHSSDHVNSLTGVSHPLLIPNDAATRDTMHCT